MKKLTTIASIRRENMFRYLYADIICSENITVFVEQSSRKTLGFKEQIMSMEKYLSIVLKSNGGYCVYFPFKSFSQHAGSASLSYFKHVKVCKLAFNIHPSFNIQISLQSKACDCGKSTTFV